MAHAERDHAAALAALMACPPHFVDVETFARDRALTAEELTAMLTLAGAFRIGADGSIALSGPERRRLGDVLKTALKKFHQANPAARGITLERLRLELSPRIPVKFLSALVQAMAKAGEVALDGAAVRLADHAMTLAPADAQLWAKISPLLSGPARFRPPRIGDIAAQLKNPEAAIRKLMKMLARLGLVIEIAEDHFFLRETVGEMVDIAAGIAAQSANNEIGAAQFRDGLESHTENVGRKVAIQVLEFFDRAGVTLRRGDLHRINSQRRDHFRKVG
jgi:selenocysteine-specific elongation factor